MYCESSVCVVVVSFDYNPPDLSLIQQEVDALEELSRQLFLETVDLQATKVKCACTYRHMSPYASKICFTLTWWGVDWIDCFKCGKCGGLHVHMKK